MKYFKVNALSYYSHKSLINPVYVYALWNYAGHVVTCGLEIYRVKDESATPSKECLVFGCVLFGLFGLAMSMSCSL